MYEIMAQPNRNILHRNDSTLKGDWKELKNDQTKQLRFNTNLAARKGRTDEGLRPHSLYTDADREKRKAKLFDSSSDGWVYVAAGWKKEGATSERQPRQTNRLGLLQKTEPICAESEPKASYRLVTGNSKILTRNTLPAKSVSSAFKETLIPRSNTNSITMDMLYDNDVPVCEIELKARNLNKETRRRFSDTDKETEKKMEDSDSDDGYEKVYIRNPTVKKYDPDQIGQAPSDKSLSLSPKPRPRNERAFTKPQPKPRSKNTCSQAKMGRQPPVSPSSQSSTPPKLTLTGISSNPISPPPLPQRTHGQFYHNEREPHNQRKRNPPKPPRSPKSTVAEKTFTKDIPSSPPHKKQPLLQLQSTSPDVKAPAQPKPLPPKPTLNRSDTYLEVLPEKTDNNFSSESKEAQSSPPRRPPRSQLTTKHRNSKSRTPSPEPMDRCETSPRLSPVPTAALKDKEGYLLPVNGPPLNRKLTMQSIAKEISAVCSLQQDPPPRPPKTYTNKKSPIPSPTKLKPGNLLHDVNPTLKPSTFPRASSPVSCSAGETSGTFFLHVLFMYVNVLVHVLRACCARVSVRACCARGSVRACCARVSVRACCARGSVRACAFRCARSVISFKSLYSVNFYSPLFKI